MTKEQFDKLKAGDRIRAGSALSTFTVIGRDKRGIFFHSTGEPIKDIDRTISIEYRAFEDYELVVEIEGFEV